MTLETRENGRRELASAVKRLRVAATSDPQRTDDLADALVELTANRLLAWDFTEAAADAPDSVVVAARILASRGPTGPYASVPDAVRYFTATAQLAAVQAGLGQTDAAGRTLDGLDAWRAQVSRLPLASHLPDAVVIWSLVARARALVGTDPALANAHADAAELRLHELPQPPAYLAVATHLLTAECRWAAGRTESALAHHRLALAAHADAVATLDPQPRPAVSRVAAAPVVALYEPYAQRLAAAGELITSIAVRREEVELLVQLSADPDIARAGLADALAEAGRDVEAAAALSGVGVAAAGPVAAPPPGARTEWAALPAAAALAPAEPSAEARARWQQAEQAAMLAGAAVRAEAARDEEILRTRAERAAAARAAAQADAEQRAAEEQAAARAERDQAERRESELAAERAQRDQESSRAAADARRRELAEEHRPSFDPDAARRAATMLERARVAVRAAGDLAGSATAHEHLAEVLRPLAVANPALTAELITILDELVALRWRLGDAEGSRAAAREAKSLGG